MKEIIRIHFKTIVFSMLIILMFWLAFSLYNKTIDIYEWNDIQRGNIMVWFIISYILGLIYSYVYEFNK